jgi:hypothetical protein
VSTLGDCSQLLSHPITNLDPTISPNPITGLDPITSKEHIMPTNTLTEIPQGDLELLSDERAQRLLNSTEMAHLAYAWRDGTPRCTAIWFHWNGTALVVSSPAAAPKTGVITTGTPIAVTIDDKEFPYASLNLRGTAEVDTVAGLTPEYRAAAMRYLGDEQGEQWCDQMPAGDMTRVKLTPSWVGLIDVKDYRRLPSALAG